MSKKSVKTIDQLTEEFFAAERVEYEKRVPKAFPRVATVKFTEPVESGELTENEPDIESEKSQEKG